MDRIKQQPGSEEMRMLGQRIALLCSEMEQETRENLIENENNVEPKLKAQTSNDEKTNEKVVCVSGKDLTDQPKSSGKLEIQPANIMRNTEMPQNAGVPTQERKKPAPYRGRKKCVWKPRNESN